MANLNTLGQQMKKVLAFRAVDKFLVYDVDLSLEGHISDLKHFFHSTHYA